MGPRISGCIKDGSKIQCVVSNHVNLPTVSCPRNSANEVQMNTGLNIKQPQNAMAVLREQGAISILGYVSQRKEHPI